jgi:hypothetical protein
MGISSRRNYCDGIETFEAGSETTPLDDKKLRQSQSDHGPPDSGASERHCRFSQRRWQQAPSTRVGAFVML